MGALVTKVEMPGQGDPARSYGPFPGDIPDREKSGLFFFLGTNKRSVTLDPCSLTGREMFREVWQEVEHPVIGAQRVPGPPWRLSQTPAAIRSPGPLLGQHNHWVFADLLGATPEEIEEWTDRGVIF